MLQPDHASSLPAPTAIEVDGVLFDCDGVTDPGSLNRRYSDPGEELYGVTVPGISDEKIIDGTDANNDVDEFAVAMRRALGETQISEDTVETRDPAALQREFGKPYWRKRPESATVLPPLDCTMPVTPVVGFSPR